MLDSMSRTEVLAFFSIGHTAEHLGEVQYIKGLMGLKRRAAVTPRPNMLIAAVPTLAAACNGG